ncbi:MULTISPECIES: Arm DNA-binding domain-containing protein [Stenotrophomonas]|uniref:Arm DNA-binding domain-containing protein n=1 Tax=Stenotrophomonas TaxID=40323 RepID=UPI001EE4CB72|nr:MULTISPECIES: Arm DNA-binding domain-containing protein [Stenotrophomonas]
MEVFPTGGLIWRYRYRLNGKYEKLTLGKYPALTLKNARLKGDEAAHQVAMGDSPAKKKQQERWQAQKAPPWPNSPNASSRTSSHATART